VIDKNRHLTDLRATAPAALEDISEETWREFQALQHSGEQQFQPTQPMPNVARSPRAAAPTTQARTSAADPTSAAVDQALQIARGNNRVCPMPAQWQALFELMQSLAPPQSVPPVVIDGAAWNMVPAMQKRLRLGEQIEWAGRLGIAKPVVAFLRSLPEDAWLHF
jgi:hypothetical protein